MSASKQEIRGSSLAARVAPTYPSAVAAAPPPAPTGALRGRLDRFSALVNRADIVFDAAGSIHDRILGRSDATGVGAAEQNAPSGLLEELDVLLSALESLLDGAAGQLQAVIGNICN